MEELKIGESVRSAESGGRGVGESVSRADQGIGESASNNVGEAEAFESSKRTMVRKDWFMGGLFFSLLMVGLTIVVTGLLLRGVGLKRSEPSVVVDDAEVVTETEVALVEWNRETLTINVLNGSPVGGRATAASQVLKEAGYQIGIIDKAEQVKASSLALSNDVASISGLVAADISKLLGYEVSVDDSILDGNSLLQLTVTQ